MPSKPIKIWTAKHAGDKDLLHTCLADPALRGWREEARSDAKFGKKCQVAWVDRTSISGISRINYKTELSAKCAISRFEGMREISDKVETERALERCRIVGMPGFEAGGSSYFPQTWRLPEQSDAFREYVRKRRVETRKGKRSPTFIIKPGGGSEGNGIVLVRHERNIPRYVVPTKPAVAQSYLSPLLYNGKKFDLRLYVLVRSVDPLEVLIHTEGLARFCTEDYEAPNDSNLTQAYKHVRGAEPRSERLLRLPWASRSRQKRPLCPPPCARSACQQFELRRSIRIRAAHQLFTQQALGSFRAHEPERGRGRRRGG